MATDTSTPSNPYQGPSDQSSSQPLVVVGQQITQAINTLAQDTVAAPVTVNASISNVFRAATTTSSPTPTGVNNISTTSISVIGANFGRHGIVFHNPAAPSSNVNIYVYPSTISVAPTLAAPGGAFIIIPTATLAFPSVEYANINTAFSAFASTGSNNALTILEFL